MITKRGALITNYFRSNDHTYAALQPTPNIQALEHGLDQVFVDLDLSDFPPISPNAPPDVLANYVIENMNKFKKKKVKKVVEKETMEHTLVNLVNPSPEAMNENLLDEFMDNFQSFFERESHLKDGFKFDKDCTFQLLRQEFPRCRTLLFEHLVEEFHGRFSVAAAICFFVESERPSLVRKYFLHVEDDRWDLMTSLMPTPWKRRKTWIDPPTSGPTCDSYQTFQRFITSAKNEFSEIFEGKFISKNAENVKTKVKIFTCGVCFDDYPLKSAILCSFPEVINLLELGPSTSKSEPADDEEAGPHKFCLECVRGQAVAATTEMPLAEGGVGLRCMSPKCTNPILFSKCRSFIPYQVRRLLNERIWEETLGMAKLPNLERCKRCNFAIQFEVPKDQMKVFDCLKCGFNFCRICEREWDDKHFGKSCEEMDEEEKIDVQARKIIEKMNEALIRKCHKCSLPFVKQDGCNNVHCRCGATQCYVCRKPNVNYQHFCQHPRTPNQKCKICKKCCLWEDIRPLVEAEVERIRNDAVNSGIEAEKLGK